MAKKNLAAALREAAEPLAREQGLELWDALFVKEGPSWCLRAVIDKPGGVSIDDCERLSRALDPAVDELAASAEREFTFEVSSPGLGRELRADAHLSTYIGRNVVVRLYRPDPNGERELRGALESFDANALALSGGVSIARADAAKITADDVDL